MKIRSYPLLFAATVFALVMAAFGTAGMAAQSPPVKGAIFTTDMNSNFVNGNVYDTAQTLFHPDTGIPLDKTAPYLNGGPRPNAPCTSAGLPDGDYYFQVTDPSGKVLLSYDDFVDQTIMVDINERKVQVTNGLMTFYYGTTRHTGIGKCNSLTPPNNITVQLFPYLRTPNPGGEYKVWMTPVRDYACGDDLSQACNVGSFGFIPSKSKTDNFKVMDYDGDGTPDSIDTCPDGDYPSIAPPCSVNYAVSITATDNAIENGPIGMFTITLSASAPTGGLTVFYQTGSASTNEGEYGSDYLLLDSSLGSELTGSVFIPEGMTAEIFVFAFDEGGDEGLEIVTLTLTGTSNQAYQVQPPPSDTAFVTITDCNQDSTQTEGCN